MLLNTIILNTSKVIEKIIYVSLDYLYKKHNLIVFDIHNIRIFHY